MDGVPVRLTACVLCCVAVLASDPDRAAAQVRRDPRVDRANAANTGRAPSSSAVRLKVGDCVSQDCIAVRLEDLGTDERGLKFASLPGLTPGVVVRGLLCTCDLKRCYDDERQWWRDTNPVDGGWGTVKLRNSSLFSGRLLDQDEGQIWAIQWTGLPLPLYSWNVLISKSEIQPHPALRVMCGR